MLRISDDVFKMVAFDVVEASLAKHDPFLEDPSVLLEWLYLFCIPWLQHKFPNQDKLTFF